ncbi:M23 family metallopeptidase [Corynebacterium parakroppenstedtii]|uniref:M23 family metallopeptidase n=1 Tax=Corynebacterium parakroppenstedtii TaxID=2828363 RepID=UPI001C8F8EAC|nr:M23 family metallopeptidase [Corynebacterium parakroppenstedtii]MBY0794695.1 M23 family metallopeptidase [Corynebacterium parakroppenstedtii]
MALSTPFVSKIRTRSSLTVLFTVVTILWVTALSLFPAHSPVLMASASTRHTTVAHAEGTTDETSLDRAPLTAHHHIHRHRLPVASKVILPFKAPPEPWLSGHRGVDLEAAPGTPIQASMSGTIAFAGQVGGRPVVSIQHADGIRTTYDPVISRRSRGDVVRRGDIIGVLANENEATHGPGLGWGAKIGESYIDPLTLLGRSEVRLKPQ